MLLILQHILWYNDNPCWYLSEQSIILLYDVTVQQSMHSNLKTFIFSQACEATFNMALLAWLNKYCLPYTSCYLCLYLCTWFVYANDSLWNYLWSCYRAQLLCQQLYWHKQNNHREKSIDIRVREKQTCSFGTKHTPMIMPTLILWGMVICV